MNARKSYDLAEVVLKGNLVAQPAFKRLENGKRVATFTVAVNGISRVSYLDCEVWGQLAEAVAKHFTKGNGVIITGALRQDRWTKDEQNRSKILVVVSSVAPRISTFEPRQEPDLPDEEMASEAQE